MRRIAVSLGLLALAGLALADGTAPPQPPGRPADPVRAEALKLLATWVDAQNRGDAAAYLALYDQKHFKGVKRTARGGVKTFDYAGWAADRGAMLKRQPKVAADGPSVETWLDPKSTLKPGVSRVRFLQRWKSARYADHGTKLLQLWRDEKGKQWIIYEDLLNSRPGWDDQAEAVAKLVLTPAKGDEEAIEVWRRIAPTVGNYPTKLAAVPGDPAVTRPLARALLAAGRLKCEQVVETSECGQEIVEWADLDPSLGFDDPCLRRRLALWALESGQLVEADVRRIASSLKELLGLPAPEQELPEAVLALVDGMSEPLRLELLAAAPKELAEKHLGGLSPAGIAAAYRAGHLDQAALELDPVKQRAVVLEALTDEKLAIDTRAQLLASVADAKGKEVQAAIARVADEAASCKLAMDAARALEARGDPSHLPRRPKDGGSAEQLARVLCLLVHDDEPRRLARYKELLPPKGKVLIREEIDNEFDRDEDGNRKDSSPPDEKFTRRGLDSFNLDDDFGAGDAPGCTAASCSVETRDGRYSVEFSSGPDGKLYLSALHRYRWIGCPC